MMLRLYAAATTAAKPALRRMLRKRAAKGKEIAARLTEREGIASVARPAGKLVWVHAASVGETMSALPVLQALADQTNILLTTGTVTSAKLAESRLPEGRPVRRIRAPAPEPLRRPDPRAEPLHRLVQ